MNVYNYLYMQREREVGRERERGGGRERENYLEEKKEGKN